MTAPLSGRKAQAARNDRLIVKAAREVFVADPTAPVSAVAERAGVGISALYRRYPSKEDLLRKLCADGLQLYTNIVETAVEDLGDPWTAFEKCMRDVVDADTHSITLALAGTFTPSPELYEMSDRAGRANRALMARAHEAGVVRTDLDAADLGALFEQLAALHVDDPARTRELRQRYLTIILDGIRTPARTTPLPYKPPTVKERADRWLLKP